MRVQAVGVIGFLKLEESIPALTALTNDTDAHVRRAAVSALAFSHMKTAAEIGHARAGGRGLDGPRVAAETLGTNARGAGRGSTDRGLMMSSGRCG